MDSQAEAMHSITSMTTAVGQAKQKANRTPERDTSVKEAQQLLIRHYGIDKEPSEQHKDFLRGVMENNREYSEEQWSQQEDKIIAALYARALLRAKGKDKNSKGRYKALTSAFEDKAVDQLKKLQKDDKEGAKELLLKKFESWGGLDCITLAVKTKCGRFLALKSAQKAVSSVWNGAIECQSDSILFWMRLYMALLFPPMLFYLHYKNDEQYSNENKNAGCCWNGLQKIYRFYRAPTVAFRLNVIFCMIFLGLYSYMVLVEFGDEVEWGEIVIWFWILTILIGEINEAGLDDRVRLAAIKSYFSSTWNIIDYLSLFIFAVGFLLRFDDDCVDIVRIIYSIDLIVFCGRFLQTLTVNKHLGPKLVMIKDMVKDLIGFLVILVAIMYGYSVALEAILYPNSRLTWKLPFSLAHRAFFQIFGELFLDDIEGSNPCTNNATLYEDFDIPRCPSLIGASFAPFLLGVYILLTNVLLLNLLIAMFTYTFERIQSKEKQHWNLERARLVLEYKSGPAFPPPLNVFCILYSFVYKKCCKKDSSADTTGSTANNGGPTTPRMLSPPPLPTRGQHSIQEIKSEMEDLKSKLEQLIQRLDKQVIAEANAGPTKSIQDTLMTTEANAGPAKSIAKATGKGKLKPSPRQVPYENLS